MFIPKLSLFALVALVVVCQTGCRRNLMRITSDPPGSEVFIQGKMVRIEDSDRMLSRKIDSRKERQRPLNDRQAAFDSTRNELQLTPVDYEFESVGCGYSIRVQKEGYHPVYQVEYIKPRWYEYPPIDLIVDLLPLPITDRREFHYELEKKQ